METAILIITTLTLAFVGMGILFGMVFLNFLNMIAKEQAKIIGLAPMIVRILHIADRIDKRTHAMLTEGIEIRNPDDDDEDGSNGKQVFKSADGKHTAHSLEELIDKMSKDPQYQHNEEDEEGEEWKKNIEKEIESDDDDEDDEDDKRKRK